MNRDKGLIFWANKQIIKITNDARIFDTIRKKNLVGLPCIDLGFEDSRRYGRYIHHPANLSYLRWEDIPIGNIPNALLLAETLLGE